MNEITISKDVFRDKYVQAMKMAENFLNRTENEENNLDNVINIAIYGALIGAGLMKVLYEEGEEE